MDLTTASRSYMVQLRQKDVDYSTSKSASRRGVSIELPSMGPSRIGPMRLSSPMGPAATTVPSGFESYGVKVSLR